MKIVTVLSLCTLISGGSPSVASNHVSPSLIEHHLPALSSRSTACHLTLFAVSSFYLVWYGLSTKGVVQEGDKKIVKPWYAPFLRFISHFSTWALIGALVGPLFSKGDTNNKWDFLKNIAWVIYITSSLSIVYHIPWGGKKTQYLFTFVHSLIIYQVAIDPASISIDQDMIRVTTVLHLLRLCCIFWRLW